MSLFDNIKGAIDSTNSFLSKNGFDTALSLLSGAKSSDWQGLSPHLIAEFYPVMLTISDDGSRNYVLDVTAGRSVFAPLLDGAEIEYSFNWQSPFEQMGTESKAPALTAMLQSGVMASAYEGFMASTYGEKAAEAMGGTSDSIGEAIKSMEGRTGITKLNSTQTFSGMAPVKCTMKLLFRAYSDPKKEVMQPIQQLLEWAVPKKLSPDSSLVLMAKLAGNTSTNVGDYISALLPSEAPQMIAMRYKGRLYSPMVIESITDPITSPTTSGGDYASAEVSLSLASLFAWDKADIKSIYR